MAQQQQQVLQFQPLTSAVEAAFWHELGEAKIEKFKLDDQTKPIRGYYSAGSHEDVPPRVCLGSNALASPRFPPPPAPPASSCLSASLPLCLSASLPLCLLSPLMAFQFFFFFLFLFLSFSPHSLLLPTL